MHLRRFLPCLVFALMIAAFPVLAQDAVDGTESSGSPMRDGPPPIPGLSKAHQRGVDAAIPFTPEMILEIRKRAKEAAETTEGAGQEIAFPESRGVKVSFVPGQATNIIQSVHGYPTAVSFFDSTGAPWPVEWNTNSNASSIGTGSNCSTSQASNSGGGGNPTVSVTGFSVCVPSKGSNVVEITPMSPVPRGGLVVMLEGAPKPITFLLIGGKQKYDSDLSVRVAERGPKAKVSVTSYQTEAPTTGAPYFNNMLSGIAPADAVPLSVIGVSPDDVTAWRLGGDMFVRTRYTLMTPSPVGSERGEGNITIYQIPATPVILLSVDGITKSAQLKDEH